MSWTKPSNFEVIVESSGENHFMAAMSLVFEAWKKATHYKIDEAGMHLFWHGGNGVEPLPYEMDAEAASYFVWNWLKKAERGPEPDMDGSVYPDGFRIESKTGGWSYEFVNVRAIWTEYHK